MRDLAGEVESGRPPTVGVSGATNLVSVVVPAYDEAGSIVEFHRQLGAVVPTLARPVEIIYVDDGSTDGTAVALDAIAAADQRVVVAHMRRNYGKSAALDLGFRLSAGGVVITLDADLQDDPVEIPRFLAAIADGNDVVSGWKKPRHDTIDKTLPSLVFNWFTRKVSGLEIHDFNSGFKAYRREALADLRLYGELHRYIPVLLHWEGFAVGEIDVAHRPRLAGHSKFGARRLLTGAFDLMTVLLTAKFRSRPLHFFGYVAVALGALGGLGLSYLFILSFFEIDPLRPRPMLYASITMIFTSVILIATGLLGEFVKSLEPTVADYPLRSIVRSTGEPTAQADD